LKNSMSPVAAPASDKLRHRLVGNSSRFEKFL
jgi:hypothetical protein